MLSLSPSQLYPECQLIKNKIVGLDMVPHTSYSSPQEAEAGR